MTEEQEQELKKLLNKYCSKSSMTEEEEKRLDDLRAIREEWKD